MYFTFSRLNKNSKTRDQKQQRKLVCITLTRLVMDSGRFRENFARFGDKKNQHKLSFNTFLAGKKQKHECLATSHVLNSCTVHAYHFFYNIDAFNIFPWMKVFIESPAYTNRAKMFIQKSDKGTQQHFSWIAVS